MCGICGMVGSLDEPALNRMISALGHRGPDDAGKMVDRTRAVGIGHTRLSILDLSACGHQPMKAADGRVWIAYNGEIYNHHDIRDELAGTYSFLGTSDTETILAAYLKWGRHCIQKLNGMFAFAIWDARDGTLWAVRDRFGVKPLYYSVRNRVVRFASEVTAFLADPRFPRTLNLDAVDAYLRLRYVVHPHTLISEIKSLAPGHQLVWKDGDISIDCYWEPAWEAARQSTIHDAQERFEALLSAAVRRALLSDVPVGVFLSGGLDSTLVTTLARQSVSTPIETFSVGFDVRGVDDDFAAAAQVANALGCKHHAFTCTAQDFWKLPEVARRMDQPVGDAVILPTMMLAQNARSYVKAVLTGEGADEILMGYAHQSQLIRLAQLAGILNIPFVAGGIRWAAATLPIGFWNSFFNYGASLGRAGVDRMLALLADINSAARRYMNYVSLFGEAERAALYGPSLAPFASRLAPAGLDLAIADNKSLPISRRLHRLEFTAWLPDNILTKQDGLTMMNGLEARVPYLDHTVVEEALSWDEKTFAVLANNKTVLKQHLARLAPALPRRRKQAFRFDVDGEYQKFLVSLVRDTLSSGTLVKMGLIDAGSLLQMIDDLGDSPFVRSKQLVSLVVLEQWITAHLTSTCPELHGSVTPSIAPTEIN